LGCYGPDGKNTHNVKGILLESGHTEDRDGDEIMVLKCMMTKEHARGR